jgi:hypothetical protein
MLQLLDQIPANAWMVLAVGIVGFLLLVGIKILRGKKIDLHVGPVEINVSESKNITHHEKKDAENNAEIKR